MPAATYRAKPRSIQAVRYDGTNSEEIVEFMGGPRQARVEKKKLPGPGRGVHDGIVITTLAGSLTASDGDWLIRDAAGGYQPCKPDAFEATYEVAQ